MLPATSPSMLREATRRFRWLGCCTPCPTQGEIAMISKRLLVPVCAILVACGTSMDDSNPDSGPDAAKDAPSDGNKTDTGTDSGKMDSGIDTGIDTGVDTGVDAMDDAEDGDANDGG